MSSGSRKRLLRQLDAALTEIERLKGHYQRAIEQLERSVRQNLSPSGCAQWFELVRGHFGSLLRLRSLSPMLTLCSWQYLRVVDLGVEIRRGEIRHRSARQIQFSCMHTTGIKGATHSGRLEHQSVVGLCRTDRWNPTRRTQHRRREHHLPAAG
jgi:hypothetical protein